MNVNVINIDGAETVLHSVNVVLEHAIQLMEHVTVHQVRSSFNR